MLKTSRYNDRWDNKIQRVLAYQLDKSTCQITKVKATAFAVDISRQRRTRQNQVGNINKSKMDLFTKNSPRWIPAACHHSSLTRVQPRYIHPIPLIHHMPIKRGVRLATSQHWNLCSYPFHELERQAGEQASVRRPDTREGSPVRRARVSSSNKPSGTTDVYGHSRYTQVRASV
jgi:hypothetical protein